MTFINLPQLIKRNYKEINTGWFLFVSGLFVFIINFKRLILMGDVYATVSFMLLVILSFLVLMKNPSKDEAEKFIKFCARYKLSRREEEVLFYLLENEKIK
jgi:hypothetical protein